MPKNDGGRQEFFRDFRGTLRELRSNGSEEETPVQYHGLAADFLGEAIPEVTGSEDEAQQGYNSYVPDE